MAPVGKGVLLLMFLLFGEFIPIEASHEQHCKMEDFPVQENFDEDRFQGKWYEVSWILLPWFTPEGSYHDYIHINTKTSYGFSIIVEGRWPINATECLEPRYPKYFRTTEDAKYLHEDQAPDGLINTTLWIVDTDYDNYALLIGCRELALNGTCVAPDGGLWMRCQNKPRKHVEYMESRLPDFCLSKDQFYTTHQNMECRPDIPDSCTVQDRSHAGYRLQPALITGIITPILVMTLLV